MDELPLVATHEYGGPYDSASYIAGWEMGQLAQELSSGLVTIVACTVRAENLRQADLIAMAAGFTLRAYGSHGGLIDVEIRYSPESL